MTSKFDSNLRALVTKVRFNSLGFFFISFIIPIIAYLDFGVDALQMGMLFSLQIVGATISGPLIGLLADRRKLRAKLIFIGSVGRLLAYVLLYLSIIFQGYWLMAISTFSLGFAAGFFWSPLRAIISDATEYQYRSEAFGILSQQTGMGTFYGALVGFTILITANEASLGPEWAYVGLLVFGLANVYAGIQILRITPRVPLIDISEQKEMLPRVKDEIKEYSTTSLRTNLVVAFVIFLVILFVESIIGSLIAPFVELFILANITEDIITVAWLYAPAGFISMLVAPKLGEIADKVRPRYWLSLTSILGALTTWLLINTTEPILIALLFIIDTTVVASAGLVLSKILSNVSKNRRGSIFGLQGFSENTGLIAGPLVGGILWEGVNYRAPFLLSIGVELVISVVYFLILSFFIFDINAENKNETIDDL
ncbi:MAG: MFS transporter [Promethearchaeota archaeon]